MSFNPAKIVPQTLYTTLTTKLKKYQTILKKVEELIKNSVAHKYQPALKGKTAKEMWEALKAKFHHIFPMSISYLILDKTMIQLSDYTNIHKYCDKYQDAFDVVCSLIRE